jgi:hypothetical protein
MSILILANPISEYHIVFLEYSIGIVLPTRFLCEIDIFYPSGEPISLQSLRCSPLAVVHYSFVGHFLAFAATSTLE